MQKDTSGAWAVEIGTGTGFGSPTPISGFFVLSSQLEQCDGTSSTTTEGLFDVDGDGRADLVSGGKLWLLVGSSGEPGAADAGRLVTVDNGFGAQTQIHYRSIKGDPGTHHVPFPEVVVDSVSTVGTRGLGGDLSAMRYAYDGAELMFDPAADAFVFKGYRRRLELPTPIGQQAGVAALMLTDYYAPISPVDPYGLNSIAVDRDTRYMMYLRAGRVRDVTVLSGDFGTTKLAIPSQLLSIDVTSDGNRIGQSHYEWAAQLFATSSDQPSIIPCSETVYPYDYSGSLTFDEGNPTYDACSGHGFAYQLSVDSWRGEAGAAPPSAANVETRSQVQDIDNFGRIRRIQYSNDFHRDDDDVWLSSGFSGWGIRADRVVGAPAVA